MSQRQESHQIHDETEIGKVKDVVKSVTIYIHDELVIGNSEHLSKIETVRNSLAEAARDFCGYVLEASYKLNYSTRVNNLLADLFIHLRWLSNDDQALVNSLSDVLNRSIANRPELSEVSKVLLMQFYQNFTKLTLNFVSVSKFREIYSEFVQALIRDIIKKA